jgi:hypothetical protein
VIHERHFERCPRPAFVIDQQVVDQDAVDQHTAADQHIVGQHAVSEHAANEHAADRRFARHNVVGWHVVFAPSVRWRQRRPGSGRVRIHQNGGSAKRRVRAELKSPREQARLIFNS